MSPSAVELRAQLLDELRKDLIGPQSETETLSDPPAVAYLTGILYPANTEISLEEDEKLEEINIEESEDNEENDIIILPQTMNPASIGLSFAIEDGISSLNVEVSYGLYKKLGPEKADPWQRSQYRTIVPLSLARSSGKVPLENQGSLEWILRARPGNKRSISLFLVNRNTNPDAQGSETRNIDDLCLFQPCLRVWSSDTPYPFTHRVPENSTPLDPDLDSYNLLYRNCYEFAIGHGCAAEWSNIQGSNAGIIWTSQIPSFELPATIPNEMLGLSMENLGKASQTSISGIIRPLLDDYESWLRAQRAQIPYLPPDLQTTADIHLNRCSEALKRMTEGLRLIETDQQVFRAFRFANQAMFYQRAYGAWAQEYRQTGKRTPRPTSGGTWRPFQLAFILLNIPGLVDPSLPDRDQVDLLWFPTGGGKTEAYLGLIAFTLALRRLRGPKDGKQSDGGVTVIMRYTLRLLTTQQFQRASTLICACERLRRSQPDVWGKRPFQIGLWVGSGATPNDLKATEEALEKLRNNEEVKTGNPRQLTSCPWCGETLTANDYLIYQRPGATEKVRLFLVCPNTGCLFHVPEKMKMLREGKLQELEKSLPVILIDDDIYHQCPSLLIATVDKFASLPWQPKTMALFGMVNQFCPDHGYIIPTEDHPVHRGSSSRSIGPCAPFLPPELIIQDELHLISGPLGTLTGLYEAAIDRLCTHLPRNGAAVRPKIIASTATIRRADDQVKGLFAREVRLFPPSSLSVEDSYFAVSQPLTKRPGRLYAGICAPGRSVKTALVRVYALLLQVAGEQLARYGTTVADPYTTLLGYFNSLRELGGALRLVEDDIVQRIRFLAKQRQQPEREIKNETRELTSRIASYKIPEILSQLEKPVGVDDALDVLLATNMISVGVDINRLGLMVVNGQPKTSAEYIQATSRIGRQASAPGLVITVFNWSRPRDVSHYERFRPYHEAIYRHVEATSVTPFAPRARDRALHAVFVALARLLREQWTANNSAHRFENSHALVRAITSDILTRARLVDPTTVADVETQLRLLTEWWSGMANRYDTSLRYRQNPFYHNNTLQELLHPAAETGKNGSRATLNSLREVEGETQLFMVWE